MKNKVKEFIKSYLPGFILGVISAAVVVVYAETYFPSNQVTYDNTESGLSSTNVQTAIDELYNTCFPSAGDEIIKDNELEKDPYECRYFFTGANPNNYVTFNGETAGWRIISVECDGRIKIMRDASIGNKAWDSSTSNWSRPASLNTYLNGEYYNNLTSAAQGQIVASDFSIGAVTDENNDLAGQVSDENSTLWNGKIALPTVSEYLRINSNSSQCQTISLNFNNSNVCINSSWMFNSTNWWTLSPNSRYGTNSFYVEPRNYIWGQSVFISYGVRPALYLSSEVQITGGTGTSSDPFTISL